MTICVKTCFMVVSYGAYLGLSENYVSKPIFILQKRAMHLMTFNNLQCPSSPLFSEFHILKAFDLVKSLNIFFIHNFLNNKLPSYLLNSFAFNKVDHTHDTRVARMGLLSIPTSNTITFGIKSFSTIAISQWNEFQRLNPENDLSLLPFNSIKKLFINHCLESY